MATISCTTKFDLASSPKVFAFTDTSDWAGQGIATANVNGCLKIVKNIGGTSVVYYNNTDFSDAGCDILINTDLENQLPINLPLAANGFPQVGDYTIIYTVYNKDTDETYTQEYAFSYSYIRPVISISQEADCLSPMFKSIDNTNYAIVGADLTLVRQHKLTYPAGSVGTFIVNGSATITTSVFYNGTQTTTISSSVEYVFTDGLIVTDLIKGSKEEFVDCRDICSITCCITAFENRMVEMKTSNYAKYLSEYKYQWLEMMGYVGMIKNLAIPCGVNNDKISYYLSQIKAIGNCTDDCCTEADDYSQVQGLGSINVVVSTGGSPVEVETVISSGTVTYTITLADAFVQKVNNSYNTIVAAGDNITVTVTTGVDGTKTYTVSAPDAPFKQRARNTAGISVSNGAGNLNTDVDLGVSITVGQSGNYAINASINSVQVIYGSANNPAGTSNLRLKVNGTAIAASTYKSSGTAGLFDSALQIFISNLALVAGDVVDIYFRQATTHTDEQVAIEDFNLAISK